MSIWKSTIHHSFLGVLSTQLHLHSLCLDSCNYNYKGYRSTSAEAKADAMSTLKGFKTLRKLEIDIDDEGWVMEDMTFIGHLAELQQLKSLSLWHCNPVGLEQVLLCVPLTFLKLINDMLPLDLRLHSDTLETLSLSLLSHEIPFTSDDFPRLQSLELPGISLPEYDVNDEELRSIIEMIGTRLASLPLKLNESAWFCLRSNTSSSNKQRMDALKYLASLAPLKLFFAAVEGLDLEAWPIGPGSMLRIAGIFCNAKEIDAGECGDFDDDGGLRAAICANKNLQEISINIKSTVPKDIIGALIETHYGRRPFRLRAHVSSSVPPAFVAELRAISKQWATVYRDARRQKAPAVIFMIKQTAN